MFVKYTLQELQNKMHKLFKRLMFQESFEMSWKIYDMQISAKDVDMHCSNQMFAMASISR